MEMHGNGKTGQLSVNCPVIENYWQTSKFLKDTEIAGEKDDELAQFELASGSFSIVVISFFYLDYLHWSFLPIPNCNKLH